MFCFRCVRTEPGDERLQFFGLLFLLFILLLFLVFLLVLLLVALQLNWSAIRFQLGLRLEQVLLLRFVEDQTKRTLVPDLRSAPGIGSWIAAWSNWNGLAVFLCLGVAVYWYSRRAAE